MIVPFSYELLSEAEKEYLEAFAWYEEQQEGLGDRFMVAVRRKIMAVSINPYLYASKKHRYHEVLLDDSFPFVIVYLIDKKRNHVIITSVFHTSRNPGKKYRKK